MRPHPLVRLVNTPRKYLKRVIFFNDVRWHVRWALRGNVHEDRFWAEYAAYYDPAFRIAPVDVALRFAFEAEPRRCYERIGRQRPFGAHRWQKFDRGFYEPWLLQTGPGSQVRFADGGPEKMGAEVQSDSVTERCGVLSGECEGGTPWVSGGR